MLTCLKLGPALKISCTRSSTERISHFPSDDSMIPLLVRGMRCLLTFPYPRLYISSRTDFKLGSLDQKISRRTDQKKKIVRDVPVCDIRFNKTEHLLSCPCNLDENTIVDLEEAKELEDFARFGCNFIDTKVRFSLQVHDGKLEHTHPRMRITKYTFGSAGT
jgi:hypothetical protein